MEESAYHVALNSNLPIYIVRDQIIILEENKANIHVKNNGETVLDLAIKNRLIEMKNPKSEWQKATTFRIIGSATENDNSIIKLLILCGCIADNHNQFFEYYFSLNFYDRTYLKSVIQDNLYCNNQRLAWELSLSTIFPIYDEKLQKLQSGDSILKTSTLGNRIVKSKHLDKIFQKGLYKVEENNNNKKYGKQTTCILDDGVGNKMIVSVFPIMPGSEIAIQSFNLKLFGTSSYPFSEFALLDDIPILIAQTIPGTTLAKLILQLESYDPLDYVYTEQHRVLSAGLKPKKPKELFSIESYNISQILINAILINEGASGFINFFVYKSGDVQYRMASADSFLAFFPSILIHNGEISLPVENDIFLLDHMFEFVKIDIDDFMVDWLNHLQKYHDSSISLMKSIKEKKFDNNDTVVGVPFSPGQIENVYSKLIRLKSLFISNGDNKITHLDVFQYLEPYVTIKYKPFLLDESMSIYEKYLNYSKTIFFDLSLFHQLEVGGAQTTDKFFKVLYSGEYGPKQAFEEYYKIKAQNIKFAKSIKDINIVHN